MAHTFATLMASKKGRGFKLGDFVLKWGAPRRRRQTGEDQLNIFRALALRQEKRRVDNR